MTTITQFQQKVKEEFKAGVPKHINELVKSHKYNGSVDDFLNAVNMPDFFNKENMPDVSAQALSNYLKSFTYVLENDEIKKMINYSNLDQVIKILHTWRKKYAAIYREEVRNKSSDEESNVEEISVDQTLLQKRVDKAIELLKTYAIHHQPDLALNFIIEYLETGFNA